MGRPRESCECRFLCIGAVLHSNPVACAKALNECSICLTRASAKRCVDTPCCAQTFHAKCIHTWLRKNGSCPLCRTELLSRPLHMDSVCFGCIQGPELSLARKPCGQNEDAAA